VGWELKGKVAMKNSLEASRRQAVRNLEQVNREIEAAEKSLKQIEARLAVAQESRIAA
jgi:hypothetical protein